MIVRKLKPGSKPGTDVQHLQQRLRGLGYLHADHKLGTVYGVRSMRAAKAFKRDHYLHNDSIVDVHAWRALEKAYARAFKHTVTIVKVAEPLKLREKALAQARNLVGVMEQGGNNVGPTVTKIISENGGTGPEPWCGDFVAYCYRHAGSKRVERLWASVAFLGTLSGLVTTTNPQPGDVVRFTFSHTGLFVKDNGDGTITTIEGNTGSSGAISDSATGGDGVYIKVRSKSLVANYRHVIG